MGDDGRDREEKVDSIRRRAVGTARRKVGRRRKGKEDSVSQSVAAVVVRRITGFHVTGSSDVPLFLPCPIVRGGRGTGWALVTVCFEAATLT